MTSRSNGQFTITSKEEIFERCEYVNFVDCRINAYPEYIEYNRIMRQPPDFIFIDLDLSDFDNDKTKIDRALKRTLNKLARLGHRPTTLWTGNGYHVYILLDAMVLDQIDIFSKDNFQNLFGTSLCKYYNYSVSELFLKFAKEYFTDGKADPLHHPKFKSCLIRIPDTFNLKCLNRGLTKVESMVKIVQRWDGKRLPIQLLLKDFRRWIVQEEIDENKKQNVKSKSNRNIRSITKDNKIDWIENLIHIPIKDYRKYSVSLILSPYLINVKKTLYYESYHILTAWLSKCDSLRKLDFNPDYLIKSSLNTAISKGIPPMRLDTLKNMNRDLYYNITK